MTSLISNFCISKFNFEIFEKPGDKPGDILLDGLLYGLLDRETYC